MYCLYMCMYMYVCALNEMQVFYVFFGCVAGYISARLYKSEFEILHVIGSICVQINLYVPSYTHSHYTHTHTLTHSGWRPTLENKCPHDCLLCSWDCLWCVLHSQHVPLGSRLFSCHSLHHAARFALPLVWYLSASHLLWLLPWLQKSSKFSCIVFLLFFAVLPSLVRYTLSHLSLVS